MAQTLKDAGVQAKVRTVDIDAEVVRRAKQNVEKAGLTDYADFSIGDSLGFLRRMAGEEDRVDFAFLDGNHEFDHVVGEFEIIHPLVVACGGKVYFDNTSSGDVAEALRHIRKTHGGNLLQFDNCSWSPPGNAIWQP
jgi:predicted O-methyltransferase YrrM